MKKLFKDLLEENGIEVVERPGFMINHNSSIPVLKKVANYEMFANQKRKVDEELKVFINITNDKCITFKDSMDTQVCVNNNAIIIDKWSYEKEEWLEITIPINQIID